MTFKPWLASAVSLSLAACSTTASFTSDFDDQQDFASYKTFAWADESPMTIYGKKRIPPTVEPKIARAIKAELEAKGFRYVADRANADFAVSFSVGTRTETDVVQSPTYFYSNATNWRWGTPYYPAAARAYPRAAYPARVTTATPVTVNSVESYTEGTLAIDIFDVDRKSPVWHGAGVKTLNQSDMKSNPGALDPQKIREGVAKILKGFPPQ